MTTYHVFCVAPDGSLVHTDIADATSGAQAIRRTCGGTGGLYVAVPARSFTRRKVTVETTTRVRVEPA